MNYIVNFEDVAFHVLKEYPREAGGYVGQDNVFVPVPNISEDPENSYELDAGFIAGEDVKCIIHSHPYDPTDEDALDPRIPSKQDLQCQDDMAVEWAIVATDGKTVTYPIFWGNPKHRPPLMQREFILNVQDCFSFVADWYYREYKVVLPVIARNPEDDYDFVQFAAEWGFIDVTDEPEQKGDVVVMKYASRIMNHVGVVVEPNLIAHHINLVKLQCPKQEPTEKLRKYIVKRFRRKTGPGQKENT